MAAFSWNQTNYTQENWEELEKILLLYLNFYGSRQESKLTHWPWAYSYKNLQNQEQNFDYILCHTWRKHLYFCLKASHMMTG